ncbi:MAG: hypothetical protein HZB59_03860 [Ignavibacteriales bacterium]|nr:hypothetical protein [Ignavibacteriales bacterium]
MNTKLSPFLTHDHVLTDVARYYSNLDKQPYVVMVGDYPGYDIASLSEDKRLEVKVETTPIRTGNVAIEFWNSSTNRPSGILATEANIWLHIVMEKDGFIAYEFDLPSLIKLVIESGEIKKGGTNALCKIIPLSIFRKSALRYFAIIISHLSVFQKN